MLYQITPGKVGVDPQVKPPFPSVVDWTHPLSRGIRHAFVLNEKGSNLYDCARLIGSIVNGSPLGSWIDTKYGSAYKFNGSTYFDNGSLVFPFPMTVACLTYPLGIGGSQAICSMGGSGGRWWTGYFSTVDTRYGFAIGGVGGYIWDNIWTNNVPTQTVLTVVGTEARLYKDGIDKGTNVIGTLAASSARLLIGAYYDGSTYSLHYNGTIVWLYIWSRALTQPEIQSLYLSPYQFVIEA